MSSIDKRSKVGNTILYLIEKIPNLYMTKALKLLYIVDEMSMKETGVPVTWLEYKAWEKGPVAKEVYNYCKSTNGNLFSDYFSCSKEEVGGMPSIKLNAVSKFNDSEFTDYEIELFDRIILKYGKKSSDDLIEILHSEGSQWDKVVQEKELKIEFELQGSKTDHTIPFIPLIEHNEILKLVYRSAYLSNSEYQQSVK